MFKAVRKHRFGMPVAATEMGVQASRRRAGRKYPEAELQRSVVAALRARGEWCVYVENEAKRSPQAAARWAALGGSPGYPDIQLPLRLIAIEMKAPERRNEKDGGCTREQLNAHEALRRHGWTVIVAYAIEDIPGWLLNGEAEEARCTRCGTRSRWTEEECRGCGQRRRRI